MFPKFFEKFLETAFEKFILQIAEADYLTYFKEFSLRPTGLYKRAQALKKMAKKKAKKKKVVKKKVVKKKKATKKKKKK